MCKDFASEQLAPHMQQWDADEEFPVDALRQAASLGLGAIYTRADVGGSEMSRMDASLIFEVGVSRSSQLHARYFLSESFGPLLRLFR